MYKFEKKKTKKIKQGQVLHCVITFSNDIDIVSERTQYNVLVLRARKKTTFIFFIIINSTITILVIFLAGILLYYYYYNYYTRSERNEIINK